jgi:hypothetical protein
VLTSAEAWRGFVTDNEIEFVVEADYCNENESLEATIPDETLRDELELLFVASPFDSPECETLIENRVHMEHMHLSKWQRVGPIIRVYAVPR